MQGENLFHRRHVRSGICEVSRRDAFLCAETGKYFLERYREMNL